MIKLDHVSKYYQSGDQVSVGMKHISLHFEIGEFIAITGESGSGKSTLLNVISGLDKYEDGEMYIMGEETSHFSIKEFETYRASFVGFVFQNYNIIDSYTVYQNVILALELQGYDASKRKKRALELIEKVGLTKQKHQKASKLSGGQKQRAVIARALAKDTPILVCDEPTGNLDQDSAKSIMALLHEVSKDKLLIVVTHEFDQVAPYATRRIKMSDGEVVEDQIIKTHAHTVESYVLPTKSFKKQVSTIFILTLRGLFAQPKRFIFMLFLLTVVISVFTVVYSNQMYGIRTTGLEQSQIFPSVPSTRILVERRDGEVLSNDEIAMFESYSGVSKVYQYGALFLNTSKVVLSLANSENFYDNTLYIDYMDSATQLYESDLTSGRLPVAMDEIVINDYYNYMQRQASDTLVYNLYFQDYFWDREFDFDVIASFKIVGTTNKGIGNTIYFSDAYLSQPYPEEAVVDIGLKMYQISMMRNNIFFTLDNQRISVMKSYENEVEFDVMLHEPFVPSAFDEVISITFKTMTLNNQILEITKEVHVSMTESNLIYFAYASEVLFDTLIEEFLILSEDEYTRLPQGIASISVENQLSGKNLTVALDHEIYKVYYPSNISSGFQSFFTFLLTILAFIIVTILGLFLYAIIHAVTRNMMQSRVKDFSIFRSVGAHEQTLSFLVILEQIVLSGLGLVISISLLNSIVAFVPNSGLTIEYMGVSDYMILTTFIMLFSIWLGLRFNKKVFKQTVIQSLTNGGNV